MGGQRFASSQPEVIEAADPARTMPKWLVIAAVLAVILLVAVMSWLNSRSLEQPESTGQPRPPLRAGAGPRQPRRAAAACAAARARSC